MKSSDIINQVLEYAKMNPAQFARHIGLKRAQNIYDIQKKENVGISKDVAEKIVKEFPEINKGYLLTGEGEMIINPKDPYWKQLQKKKIQDDYKEIPVYGDNKVLATPELNESQSLYQPTEYRKVSRSMFEDAAAIMPVYGSSMMPMYPPGCEVALIPDNASFFVWGDVYALEIKGSEIPLLKRVYPGRDEDRIKLVSDNNMRHSEGDMQGELYYPALEIHLEEIIRKWAVIGDQKRRLNKGIMTR